MKENGVIYAKGEYAGLVRRLVVMVVDAAVVVGIFAVALSPIADHAPDAFFVGALVCTYLYMIEMKRRWGAWVT